MSYEIIAIILFIGLVLTYIIKRQLQTAVERDCLENMYYWTVMTLCYAFCSILYICFHANELRFSNEYQNGVLLIVCITILVVLIEVSSPSGGLKKIGRFFSKMIKRILGKWKALTKKEKTEEEKVMNPLNLKIPFYLSHKKLRQRIHYQAEDTYNMFYRFTSLVFTSFLIALPLIRRISYYIGEDNGMDKNLSDAFLSIMGFCLVIMAAICVRQLWYQLRFMKRLPLNKKNFSRMGRTVQANQYMNQKHKVL